MERFDLYDENRKPLGRTKARTEKLEKGEHRIVVHILVFNKEGKMLVQKRVQQKRVWPGYWDISCGGCVVAGESSRQGAHRELFEELGIDYDFSNKEPLFTIYFGTGFDDYYIVDGVDIDPAKIKLQAEEVETIDFMSESEILEKIDKDEFVKYHKGLISFMFTGRLHKGAWDIEV